MKLTPENLDYEDCRPINRHHGIEIPEDLRRAMREETAAARSAKRPLPKAAE